MSITLTENAIEEAKKIMEEQKLTDSSLRVGVLGGGCSGFQYSLSFVQSDEYDMKVDKKYSFDGIDLLIDKKSELHMDGTSIDFYTDINKRGFVFNNPLSVKECGCGSSFS